MELAAVVFSITVSSASIIALLKIIAIDIILSGDNAIVIAMATRNLPKKQQNKAILWGTGVAVILRILFAIVIVWLLKIPYVNIIGGILLLWISYKVLVGGDEKTHVSSQSSLIKAIGTIIMADAVMSLDNVVAIAGAANGHILMIALGVAVSIPIMIFGSKLIVRIMEKYQWISYIGSGILAWVAGEMLLKDKHLDHLLGIEGPVEYLFLVSLTILVLLIGFIANKRKTENKEQVISKNEP